MEIESNSEIGKIFVLVRLVKIRIVLLFQIHFLTPLMAQFMGNRVS